MAEEGAGEPSWPTGDLDELEELVGRVSELSCPECGGKMVLKDGGFRSRDGKVKKFYACYRCGMKHGAHPDGTPLGTPADKATRELRRECHVLLDRAAAFLQTSKNEIYHRLSRKLRIARRRCHIGEFDADLCRRAARTLAAMGTASGRPPAEGAKDAH